MERAEVVGAEADLLDELRHDALGVGVVAGDEDRAALVEGASFFPFVFRCSNQIVLNAFTTRAPGRCAATISLEARSRESSCA